MKMYPGLLQDGYFTLSEMECMGSCVNAPMIAVADYTKGVEGFSYTYYEDLSQSDVVKILEDLKAGKTPRVCTPSTDTFYKIMYVVHVLAWR